jgi:Tetrahydrofolate dehydrogenase/cyclohydrolase, catalytic domain/Tetrahydrofolate dehydrogenase/cyclohydrolase, NAD(P)-binding domain
MCTTESAASLLLMGATRTCFQAPGLAAVLVGSRKDSETYVRSKKKACEEVGIASFGTELPEDVTEGELLEVVRSYNADPSVHGILVQLPLPKHINEQTILDAIDISKDVDGFHPLNIGSLAMRGREPRYVSCTPKGCMELLKRTGVQISVRLIIWHHLLAPRLQCAQQCARLYTGAPVYNRVQIGRVVNPGAALVSYLDKTARSISV